MLKNYLALALIYFTQFITLIAQTPSYYHYTSSDGLASSTVFDIMQDRNGFIWLGTLAGLSKFDGKHFTTFTTNDGLNSNVITNLKLGDRGEIYIGNYEKGINILKNNHIENYRSKINGKNFNVTYLLKYNRKIFTYMSLTIFMINENSYVDSSDKTIELFNFRNSRLSFLHRLAKLSGDQLIALTSDGLYSIKNSKPVKIDIKGMEETDVYCLAERSDSSYFIGAKGCVYKVKNNQVIKKFVMDGYDDKLFYQIFCDRNNNTWFSVLGKGFFLIPNNSDEIINLGSKMGLENTQVDCFFEDVEGNIWIGTYGKGIYCLNNLFLRNYTERDGLNNNNIICMEKEKSGKLIIGTINGVSILENGLIDRLKDNSGKVLSGYINSIKCYDDNIYLCWAPETPEIKDVSYKGLNYRTILNTSFFKTTNGSYIYGNIGNAISIQKDYNYKKRFEYSWLPIFGDSIFQNRINAIFEDLHNNVWIGTSLGLCKLTVEPGKSGMDGIKKTFFPKDAILSSKINSIYQDNNNNLWFTGAKGIANYNIENNSIKSYSSILGHDLSTTTSVVMDSKNRIWIGSMKGLILLEGNSIKFLNSQTGLPSNEVLSLYYDKKKNILYIGTSDGLSLLDINLFDNNNQETLNVNVMSINAGDKVYTNFNNLLFEPDQNNVYINFIAIDYSSPGSVTYKYILNGDSTETKNNFLDFSSLKYGTYQLRIMAKSQNTEWGKPYILKFKILPRFVETIWFDISIISAFIIIALFILGWRLKLNSKKIREQLELTERINELKHQALSAMMNPHFISNSLSSVQYLVNTQKYEEANNYIAMMAKLMRKNLDTAGSGFILLYEEISRLKLYLDLEKLRFQESFSYEIITGIDVHTGYLMIPNMIIQPFVENSLWHGIMDSGNKGLLTVSFSFEDIEIDSSTVTSLIIKVTDNGIGLKEARKKKEEDHISRGIQIIEERLKLLSAKMNLPQPIMFEDLSTRSENAHGTEVIISLPPPLYKIINPESDRSFSNTD